MLGTSKDRMLASGEVIIGYERLNIRHEMKSPNISRGIECLAMMKFRHIKIDKMSSNG